VSNTLQDIMLTMFRDAHTDAQTNGTKTVFLQPYYIGWRHKYSNTYVHIYTSSFTALMPLVRW